MLRVVFVSILTVLAAPAAALAQSQPAPYAPGTPSAERFSSLPSRMEYGPDHLFTLDYDDLDWTAQTPIRLTMVNGGDPFADELIDDPLAQLFIQLDITDAPAATVTATFTQQNDSDATVPACTQTVTKTVHAYRRFRINADCGINGPRQRPRAFVIACGDGNLQLRRLRWRHWNRSLATATGAVMFNDCVPYCFNGHMHFVATRVRAWRPRGGNGKPYQYTRLRFRDPNGHYQSMRLNQYGYWV